MDILRYMPQLAGLRVISSEAVGQSHILRFDDCSMLVFTPSGVKTANKEPLRREPNGQFKAKEVLAEFDYQGEKDIAPRHRRVALPSTWKSQQKHSDSYIGYDLDRKATRQFLKKRITNLSIKRTYID